ncbi:hypothetical protein BASA81_005680 [Batrachochytrium salamandrivorans]|nr:hypothetical protein BASA81_005680 [Batrachochytrium salamandrivorans]
MPFGLANPAQFQRMMNSLFREMNGKYVLVYLDDIVIYSSNMAEHKVHVDVFKVLSDNRLFCRAEKCHFYQTEIKYLGYIISSSGVSMDPSKIKAVQEWPAPRKVRDLQVFLGFTNFYRALVHDYSNMTCHMTKLFKKDTLFIWGPEQQTSFENLKTAFANSTLLLHQMTHVRWTACCNRAVRPQKPRVLHVNKKVNSASSPLVSRSSEYDFTITHRSGKLNGRADPLSRRHDYKGEDDTSNFQRILDPTKVIDLQSLIANMDLHVLAHSEVLNTVFVEEDDWPLVIADFLAGSDNVWMADVTEQILGRCKTELPHFRFRDDTFVRILPDGKSTATYVRFSQRTEVMRHYHESLAHLKFGSIIDLVSRRFWWPKMKADLRNYISRVHNAS